VDCLGLLPGRVERFPAEHQARRLKAPHMGWNKMSVRREHPVLGAALGPDFEYYFVHSYYPRPADEKCVLAVTDHEGFVFPSIVGRNNLIATQFHLEKSGRPGLQLLDAFCRWDGRHAV
jgi:glutamine amidotransferase